MLDEVIAAARDDGPPADAIVTRYFKTRRYAGSKDRRAVRELVFRAIRRSRPSGRRAAARRCSALARGRSELARPVRRAARAGADRRGEPVAAGGDGPGLARSRAVAAGRLRANGRRLLDRAPLDLRVNVARTTRDDDAGAFRGRRTDAAQPVGPAAAARQQGRRSSGLRRQAWSKCRTRAAS